MRDAEKTNTLKERIVKLIENITYKTFIYTSRGLFEKDKLIFICQMAIQVYRRKKISETYYWNFNRIINKFRLHCVNTHMYVDNNNR